MSSYMPFELFITSFIAFAISAVCGGGAGLLLIPILGTYLPVTQVPTALTVGTAMSSFSRIWIFFEAVRWDIFKGFFPMALLGLALGTHLLASLDPVYLELCMSLFLVSNLTHLLFQPKTISTDDSIPTWVLPTIGFLAGMISGLTGAVGVLFNRFYLRCGMNNEEIVATRAANEALLHLIKIYIYAHLGFLTPTVFKIGIVIAIAAVFSTVLTKRILPKLPKRHFAKIGYAAMGIAGVLMFKSAIGEISSAHKPDFNVQPISKGFDTTWSWDDLFYSLEFRYQEGFEFEKVIPFSSLTADEQAFVYAQQSLFANVMIEKVYTLSAQSYEAYYYNENNKLIKKVKFKPIRNND